MGVFQKAVVPELVQEAKTGRIVKLIGVDTADRAIDACTAWILNDRKGFMVKHSNRFRIFLSRLTVRKMGGQLFMRNLKSLSIL